MVVTTGLGSFSVLALKNNINYLTLNNQIPHSQPSRTSDIFNNLLFNYPKYICQSPKIPQTHQVAITQAHMSPMSDRSKATETCERRAAVWINLMIELTLGAAAKH